MIRPDGTMFRTILADDTAVLATDCDPAIVSQKLQTNLAAVQNWFENGE
jgi:hypothetical protein